jgi:hypothetical protein
MMRFWTRNWYYVGGVLFVLLAFAMGLWGSTHLPTAQVILVFSWMAMLVHQFEEYAWPGGFPSIANYMGLGETEAPERFPLNARQCFVSNVFLCYATYIVPVFFPDLVWLAAGQVMMGLWQLPAHGIIMNRRLGSVYNPGLFATVFLQTPIAVYYIWHVCTTMPDAAWQLWLGIPVSLLGLVIAFLIPILVMRDRENGEPFELEEMYGYRGEEIRAIREGRSGEQPRPVAVLKVLDRPGVVARNRERSR